MKGGHDAAPAPTSGGMGFQGGIPRDLASVAQASEQVRGAPDRALDQEEPDELLAEGQGRAEAEQHGVVDPEAAVIALDDRPVA